MNRTPDNAPLRVLYLRSPGRLPFAAIWAGGLLRAPGIEFWQYPALPAEHRNRLDKLPNAAAAWESLQVRAIPDPRELAERIAAGAFDAALVSDEDGLLFPGPAPSPLARVRSWLGRSGGRMPFTLAELARRMPVAVADLADASFLTPAGQEQLAACTAYFKRELPFDRLFLYYQQRPAPWRQRRLELLPVVEKVRGIPLGIEDDKYAALKNQRVALQDIDVLLTGTVTSSLRQEGLKRLRTWAATRARKVEIRDSLPFGEYCARMARSKVTISISGGGWDCFRHAEAVALGSVPFMNRPYIDAPAWRDLPEAVFFDNTFRDFDERLDALLADDRLRTECREELEARVETTQRHSQVVAAIVAALPTGAGRSRREVAEPLSNQ